MKNAETPLFQGAFGLKKYAVSDKCIIDCVLFWPYGGKRKCKQHCEVTYTTDISAEARKEYAERVMKRHKEKAEQA